MNKIKAAKLEAEREIEQHIKDNYLNRVFSKYTEWEMKRYLKTIEEKHDGLIEINGSFDWNTKSFNVEVKEAIPEDETIGFILKKILGYWEANNEHVNAK